MYNILVCKTRLEELLVYAFPKGICLKPYSRLHCTVTILNSAILLYSQYTFKLAQSEVILITLWKSHKLIWASTSRKLKWMWDKSFNFTHIKVQPHLHQSNFTIWAFWKRVFIESIIPIDGTTPLLIFVTAKYHIPCQIHYICSDYYFLCSYHVQRVDNQLVIHSCCN